MRKKLVVLTILLSLVFPTVLLTPSRVNAGDVVMETVLKDTFYGGVIGTLLGIGAVLLTDPEHPKVNLEYIAYGAGGGLIVGAVFGMASSTKALAELNDNRLSFNVPELRTDIVQNKRDDKKEVIRSLSLFRYSF